jgi:copper transport protein
MVLALAAPAAAEAHPRLVSSVPENGSAVLRAPAVVFRFDEELLASASRLRVLDASGRVVASSDIEGRRLFLGVNGATLRAALPALAAGTYRAFLDTAGTDLHPTRATITFALGPGARPPRALEALPRQAEPRPGRPEVVARVLAFLSLALVGGIAVIALVAPRRVRGAERLVPAAAAVAAILALLVVVVQVLSLGVGADALAATASSTGAVTTLAQVGALAMAALSAAAWRTRAGQVATVVAAAGAAALAAIGSHATAAGLVPALLLAAHLAAATTWIGVVAIGTLTLAVPLRAGGAPRRAALVDLRRIGAVAAGCAAVVGVTGLAVVGAHVATVDALLETIYGRSVIAKTLLLALALGLALVTRRALGGRDEQSASWSVPLEAAVLVLVLVPAALLGAGAPATGVQYTARPQRPGSLIVVRSQGDLEVTLTAAPNRPGQSFLTVVAAPTVNPAAPVTAVTVVVDDGVVAPQSVASVRDAPSADGTSAFRWETAAVRFSREGPVRLRVLVTRQGAAGSAIAAPWVVGARSPIETAPALVSRRRIGGAATVVAIALAVVLAAVAIVRRRRGTTFVPRPPPL